MGIVDGRGEKEKRFVWKQRQRKSTIFFGTCGLRPGDFSDLGSWMLCIPSANGVNEISDIVEAILYLESASFVTGEILHGGQSAGY